MKGINSRMDEIQAAILNIKLRYLDQENDIRRNIARRYLTEIVNPKIKLPSEIAVDTSVFHIFPILTDDREGLKEFLKQHGIETMIHYPVPPHQQEAFVEMKYQNYPISETIHRQELSLPIYPTLNERDLSKIIDTINLW